MDQISYDDFIQTSEDRHHVGCQRFIQAVHDAGDIYKGVYAGHYCTGCESFKTEKEVAEAGGKCPNHPNTPLAWLEEENYYFRLSAYRDRLLDYYASHSEFIQPESRRNEIVNLVETELKDVAITRKGFTWGIPVPFDPDQTIYVWFDALLNYITAVGYQWCLQPWTQFVKRTCRRRCYILYYSSSLSRFFIWFNVRRLRIVQFALSRLSIALEQ